jgi:hypothetical protein
MLQESFSDLLHLDRSLDLQETCEPEVTIDEPASTLVDSMIGSDLSYNIEVCPLARRKTLFVTFTNFHSTTQTLGILSRNGKTMKSRYSFSVRHRDFF